MTRITHQINFLASGKGNRQSSGTSSAPTADGASMYIIYKLLNLTNIPAFRSSAARKKVRIIILISNESYCTVGGRTVKS